MQIASTLAGYSLGQADLLRRAMGKKKAEVMAKEKAGFVTGAINKGVDEAKAAEIFDLMAFFAGYGFNKSHSAAYALITVPLNLSALNGPGPTAESDRVRSRTGPQRRWRQRDQAR